MNENDPFDDGIPCDICVRNKFLCERKATCEEYIKYKEYINFRNAK